MKWKKFEANILDSFRELRETQSFFDVTLATEDGQTIQAHKIILSTGSNFFRTLFLKNKRENMWVYMKGINNVNLGQIIDFLYNGEVLIKKEGIKEFLDTAKDLQMKGLENEMNDETENLPTEVKNCNNETSLPPKDDPDPFLIQEISMDLLDEQPEFLESLTETIIKVDENNVPLHDDDYFIDKKIEEMIEKINNQWKCKVCGKTANRKEHIQNHAEIHIEGVTHSCHICSKIFATRPNLQAHISGIHSALVDCDDCEKSGMNKKAYNKHKLRYHKEISVKF